MRKYDVIIIGGGHNGLTAATLLAKKGKKVILFEKRDVLGGIAAGEEFHPGFKTVGLLHDTGGVRKMALAAMQLEKYGLKATGKKSNCAILGNQSDGVLVSSDVNSTAQSIAKYSQKDGEAYLALRGFINSISPFLNKLLNEIPPDITQFGLKQLWHLAKKGLALRMLGKKTMLEFFRAAPMCVADYLNEWFETDFIKAGLAAPSLYGSFTGPWSAGTCLNFLIYECSSDQEILGGPAALAVSLAKAAEANGVEIRTGAEVKKILLKNGKAYGVTINNGEEIISETIVSSCTLQETFHKLFSSNEIEFSLEQQVNHIRSRGTTVKINMALKNPLIFNFNPPESVNFYRTGGSFDKMEKAFDPVKYGEFSTNPLLDVYAASPSPENGSQAVSVIVHYAPFNLKGGWSEEKKLELARIAMNQLAGFTEEFLSNIVHIEVQSPVDIEKRYNLHNGHIFHGEHAIDQLITRPFPSCMRYKTPIPGLFLCGSGSHPGGGLTCAPGYLAAKAILAFN